MTAAESLRSSEPVEIELIDTYAEFERIKPNWSALYDIDPEAQLFLSWDWLSQLFLRRPEYRYVIVAVKEPGAGPDYVAVLPLRLRRKTRKDRQGSRNEIYMAGNYWADYTGFLCHPDHEQRAIPALAQQLLTMPWVKLHLDYFNASSRRLELFVGQFRRAEFVIKNRRRLSREDNVDGLICAYIDLPGDFDTYLANHMSANTRQKLRRFLRKVDNSSELRITHADAGTCERDLDLLAEFWISKWASRKGKEVERLAETYQQILYQALQAGMLFMPVLWRDQRPLCVLGSLLDWQKKSVAYFVAGRDESYRQLPVGLILHGHSIRWAIDNGMQTYDFLSGNEPYKYAYGVQERHLQCISITTRSGELFDPETIHSPVPSSN